MATNSDRELRAALTGAATGGRSFTGITALAATAPTGARTQPDRAFKQYAAPGPLALLAVTELVIDKLPGAPSRLAPPALAGRAVLGALCGVVVARRAPVQAGQSTEPAVDVPVADAVTTARCAAIGLAAAVGASWLGARWRSVAARVGPAWLGAVVEDVAVIGLAAAGSRSRPQRAVLHSVG